MALAICLASASGRAEDAHAAAESPHAAPAHAEASHEPAHAEAAHAEPEHAASAHEDAEAHAAAHEAHPTATEKPFFSKTAEDLIREKQQELEAAARGESHGGEEHAEEAAQHEAEAEPEGPLSLAIERIAGEGDAIAVKAELNDPSESQVLLTDVVLYWITPGGAGAVLPLKPVTDRVLAAKIQGPLEDGAHRIMVSAAVRGEDGFVMRLLEREYEIMAPDLEPHAMLAKTLSESRDGIDPVAPASPPGKLKAAGGASIFRIIAGLILGVIGAGLLGGAAWAAYLVKIGALKLGAVKSALAPVLRPVLGRLAKFRRGAKAGAQETGGGDAGAGGGEAGFIEDEAPDSGRAETAKAASQLLGEQPGPEAKSPKSEPEIVTDDMPGEPKAVDLSNSAF